MEKGKKGVSFKRQLIMEDGQPRLYISLAGEEGQPTDKPVPSREASRKAKSGHQGESKHEPAMFFGHHIGKLLVPDAEAKEDFATLDRQLASTRDAIRYTLKSAQVSKQIIAAGMMGCGDSIVPCAVDEECTMDLPGPGIPMVCNLQITPQQKYVEIYGWMDGIPFDLPIPIPDCASMSTTPGVCEASFEFPF